MRTVGELRVALKDVPDDAEWLVCVQDGDGHSIVDPGVVHEVKVLRPGEPDWPFGVAASALAYLMVGEWTS